ncbi:serine/threonine protein kinase [Occultella glacieicola]|uniref:non-specific serine/threonine protein kinase n=1 Tax=Occultella glacieicola TaxID=2518684 RepID=A0ABY2DZ44_9MICO|nr:serine/threonine-protein kinase [Occultella glacieicola]TDE89964.1 serine/threonine protein kinase [Occultella glacieicola]
MAGRRPPSPPPEIAGYTHERLVGSGGFADVFLYTQHLPRRPVAVKVMLAHATSPQAREQFVAEANVMAQLSTHPSIVTIYHADTAPDARPFLVMEYCPRPNLSVRYRTERIGVAEALRIGVRLAGAIETAHRAGILHRDIKPANVLTTDYGWPALTDFGISVATDAVEETDTIGLSIPWAAPEFFSEGAERGVAGDIYSLSATIYTLLAGRSPFEREGGPNGALDLITRIERDPVPVIGRDDVPDSLSQVLARGMAKAARDRYATAADLARAIQRVEQELRLSQTSLDVPDTSWIHVPENVGEDLRTRARSVVTVAPEAPPTTGDPLAGERTVLRPQVVPQAPPDGGALRPQAPHPGGGPGGYAPAGAPGQQGGGPSGLAPPGTGPSASEPGHGAPGGPGGASGPGPRRRWPVWAAVGGVIAVVGTGVIIGALNAPDPPEPTPTATTTMPPDDPSAAAHPPAPEDVSGTRDPDGTITFSWAPVEADAEITYVWTYTRGAPAEDSGGAQETFGATSVNVPDSADYVCISVLSVYTESRSVSNESVEGCA